MFPLSLSPHEFWKFYSLCSFIEQKTAPQSNDSEAVERSEFPLFV